MSHIKKESLSAHFFSQKTRPQCFCSLLTTSSSLSPLYVCTYVCIMSVFSQ